MEPQQAITHEGKTYNQYAISLSSAPVNKRNSYSTAVNLTYTPMYEDENGNVQLIPSNAVDVNGLSYIKRINTDDIANCGDPVLLQGFFQISKIIESVGIAKGFCALPQTP